MNRESFLKKLDHIHDLPTLPQVALEINRLLDNPRVSMVQVGETINKDQAIVPKLLRLVNSSFFGFEKKISSISRAIVILGFNTVRNAIVSVSVIDSLKDFHSDQVNFVEFWRHAISCAVVSRYMATNIRVEAPEDAFTAGLLHDIGKLVLAKYFPEEFVNIMNSVKAGLSFYEAESKVLPIHHNQIGAYLAKRWNLPQVISTAIEFTHGNHNYNAKPVSYIVAIVEKMLYFQAQESSSSDQIEFPESAISEDIRKFMDERDEWLPDIIKEIENACSVLMGESIDGK